MRLSRRTALVRRQSALEMRPVSPSTPFSSRLPGLAARRGERSVEGGATGLSLDSCAGVSNCEIIHNAEDFRQHGAPAFPLSPVPRTSTGAGPRHHLVGGAG